MGQIGKCSCKLCKENFDYRDELGKFNSTITGTEFDVKVDNVDNLPPCKLDCVIYVITCSKCNSQYVGKTKQQLRKRVYGHRASSKSNQEQVLYKHFNSECEFENAKFRIIEKPIESDLSTKEDFWIKEVMSIYPFGLNDKITGIGNMTKQDLVNFNFEDPFLIHDEKLPKSYDNKKNGNVDDIINNLESIYNYEPDIKKFLDAIKKMPKKSKVLDKILENRNNFDKRFVDIISVCVGRIKRRKREKLKEESIKREE